jgi:endogenous inhibitor of DNA gyrase (YacG/DUF329 family)
MVARRCETCDAEFSIWPYRVRQGIGRFCSPRCRGIGTRSRVERACDHCGAAFWTWPSRVAVAKSGRLYCSRACLDAGNRGERHQGWRPPLSRPCAACGVPFTVPKTYTAQVYCSRRCAAIGRQYAGQPRHLTAAVARNIARERERGERWRESRMAEWLRDRAAD